MHRQGSDIRAVLHRFSHLAGKRADVLATADAAQRQGAMFDHVVMRLRYVKHLPSFGD
jgi:hypothetical protein